MKIFIILLAMVSPLMSISQSKKDLKDDVKTLQEQMHKLQIDMEVLKARMDDKITFLQNEIAFCKAQSSSSTTNQNTQQPIYNSSTYAKPDTVVKTGLTPRTGATIHTGPRGGKYYINKNGNKTYIKHK